MRHIVLFTGIDWKALGAWIVSVNWVATSTTAGVVIFNLTIGVTAAINHVRAQRLKWRREDEEVNKESLRHQITLKDATIAERDRKLVEIEAELRDQEERIEAERKALQKHRAEINQDSLMRINEANDLRRELAQTRSELNEARRGPAVPTNNNPPHEAKS
jgi:predicted phage tail protein